MTKHVPVVGGVYVGDHLSDNVFITVYEVQDGVVKYTFSSNNENSYWTIKAFNLLYRKLTPLEQVLL